VVICHWTLYVVLQGQEFFIGRHLQGNVIRGLTIDSLVMPTKTLCQKMVLYVPNLQPYKNGCYNKYLKRMLGKVERDVIITTHRFGFTLVFFRDIVQRKLPQSSFVPTYWDMN
jgi:hypothetical protein